MAEMKSWTAQILFFVFFVSVQIEFSLSSSSSSLVKKTYVVHVEKSIMPSEYTQHLEWYSYLLRSAVKMEEEEGGNGDFIEKKIIYSYETVFHGFAAKFSEEEAARLGKFAGVAAVLPEEVYQIDTTRSPEFLGLGGWSEMSPPSTGHDVIVGVLDTGIWPESPSFSDRGLPPVPERWKGECETGKGFTAANCNRKIIGARAFYQGYEASAGAIDEKEEFKSPRDQDGHGSHTAATAAGAAVGGADLLGYARGTARGMAPNARIAAYKVCWAGGCFSSDILAAVDRAVADGADVLSISLGGGVSAYHRDSLSIAAFAAAESGVFVACSAGNGGPGPTSLTNVSPWVTTVGASTLDRDFPATVRLGDGSNLTGVSLYSGRRRLSPERKYPVVYLGGNITNPDPRSLCLEGTLDPHVVADKIVVCDRGISPRVQKGEVVKEAGGVGMILTNTAVNGEELVADSHLIPAVALGEIAGKLVKEYTNRRRRRRPTATLTFEGTKLGVKPSPVVAAFSSRGPNLLTLEVLKPDVVAPGVNILAAWSGAASPSGLTADNRRVGFNILSGTSMSCPHVAGVAALLRASHPEWSPAAVKSALMTTAYVHDNTLRPIRDAASGEPSTAYDHGAGHISPSRADDPGLIYDIAAVDYFDFLCAMKLTPAELRVFSNRTCSKTLAVAGDLNYPAISAVFKTSPATEEVVVTRTVTNVGALANSTYRVKVTPFKGADVAVEPARLTFTRRGEKVSYRVVFRSRGPQQSPEFGGLTWTDGVHKVRSPIVITWLSSL